MKKLAAVLHFFLLTSSAHTNEIDYFCIFSSAATAQADGPVSSYWSAANSSWDMSQTFPGIKVTTPQALVNGISSLTGFWIMVATINGSAVLDADTNCVMKLDRDVASGNGAFVLAAAITGSNRTSLTFSPQPQAKSGSAYPIPLGK